jgi:signal transduction histidine kinase
MLPDHASRSPEGPHGGAPDEILFDSPGIPATLQTVAEDEARERALLAVLREPVLTVAADGRVGGFNAAALALFGGVRRVYGQPVCELLPFLAQAPAEPGREIWQGQIVDAAGSTLDLEVSHTRLDGGPLPPEDVYVLHDVSRLAELSRLREQLLYSVAHELGGPLAVLDNTLDLLAGDYDALSAAEFDRLLRAARRTATRLRGLMEGLLSAGSIQAGRLLIRTEPLPVAELLDDTVEALEPQLETRGQRVECRVPSAGLAVLADRRYAGQVLANLVGNAAKYGPPGESIQIWAEPQPGLVRITVADRGPGIPPEQQVGLFERFYRAGPAATSAAGTGLGLAIAKGIVEAHGGTIGVASSPGRGTQIWFTLPRAPRRGGP